MNFEEQLAENELRELITLFEEIQERDNHESVKYSPLPKQEPFHKSKVWIRLVLGGNRSGKSRSAAQEIYWTWSGTHPYQEVPKKARIWCLSAEYRTLYEGIWLHLQKIIPPWDIAKVGSKIPGWDIPSYIESKTGSRIDFISSQGGKDARKKVQAAEIDLLSVDEEISGELWTELRFRLVSKGGRVIISATLVESEDWLIDLEAAAEQGSADVAVFRLDTRENTHNSQEILDKFIGSLSQDDFEVRILGKSRRVKGLVYAAFNGDVGRPESNVIKPRKIPDNYNRIMVYDPGFRTSAALWVAISPTLKAIAYREMYLHSVSLAEVVQFIRRAEGYVYEDGIWQPGPKTEVVSTRIIDPAGFHRMTDGTPSIGDRLATDYELFFIKGFNDKRTNIEDGRKLLEVQTDGTPGFVVFDTLENFLSERRKYRIRGATPGRDRDEGKDLPIKKDDHLMNCFEYFSSSGYAYNPYIKSLEIREAAEMADEEVDYPLDNVRSFKHKLKKARLDAYRRQLMDESEDSYT